MKKETDKKGINIPNIQLEKFDICVITTSSRSEAYFIDFFKNNTIQNKFSFEDTLWSDFCEAWNQNYKTIKIEIYMDRLNDFIKNHDIDTLIRYLSIYEGIGDEFNKNPIIVNGNILNNGNHRILIMRFLIDTYSLDKSIYLVNNPYLSDIDIQSLQINK